VGSVKFKSTSIWPNHHINNVKRNYLEFIKSAIRKVISKAAKNQSGPTLPIAKATAAGNPQNVIA